MNQLIGLDRLSQILLDIKSNLQLPIPLPIDKGGTGVTTVEEVRKSITGFDNALLVQDAYSSGQSSPSIIISDTMNSAPGSVICGTQTTIGSIMDSVVCGNNVGKTALTVTSSNIIGYGNTINADSIYHSTVIGTYAAEMCKNKPIDSTGNTVNRTVSQSTVIGKDSCRYASSVFQSVVDGYYAARGDESTSCFPHVQNSTLIGYEAGMYADFVRQAVIIGDEAAVMPQEQQYDEDGNSIQKDIERSTILGAYAGRNCSTIKDSVVNGYLACGNSKSISKSVISGNGAANYQKDILGCVVGGFECARGEPTNETQKINSVVAIGLMTMKSIDNATQDVVIGSGAGYSCSIITNSSVIGNQAAYEQKNIQNSVINGTFAAKGDSANTDGLINHVVAIGSSAMLRVNKATYANVIGDDAAHYAKTITDSDIIGGMAVYEADSIDRTVTIGRLSMFKSRSTSNNTSIGYGACYYADYVKNSTVIGCEAAKMNSNPPVDSTGETGSRSITDSIAIGANVVGSTCVEVNQSTIIGNVAGLASRIEYSTVIGYGAVASTSRLSSMTAIGRYAGRFRSSLNMGNVLIGEYSCACSGSNTNSISYCTSIGNMAMYDANGTFTYSTFIGCRAGEDLSLSTCINSTAIGYQSTVTGSNQVQLGNSSTSTYVYGTVQNRSDARDKTNITPLEYDYKMFIEKLRPVTFQWDMREDYLPELPKDAESTTASDDNTPMDQIVHDGSHIRKRRHNGFIAQEVKAVADELHFDFGGYQDHSVNGGMDVLSLGYTEFIPPIVAYIQDLNSQIQQLKQEIEELKSTK